MDQIPFDWRKIRSVLVAVSAVLALLLGVINYVNDQLPSGDVQALGVSNFDVIQVGDGSVSEPAFGFTDDTDNGLYRIGSNNVGLSAGGTKVIDANASGVSIVGTFSPSGAVSVGGGFGDTGCTLSAAGVLQCDGAATIGGAATITGATTLVDALTVGGGFGSTGCSVSAAGVLQCNGAATIGGAATITGAATLVDALTVGGGFGSTGCTVSAAGALQCDDAATIGGAATITGVVTFNGFNLYSTASITPTDGGTLTPSAEFVTLTPAGALGTAMAACTTGQRTVLYNSIDASISITDTGNFIGAGDQTLGQFDTLDLVCIDSKWVQVSAVSAN